MNIVKGLTYDDVLLIPKHSKVQSRSKVDLSVKLSEHVNLKIPIISANMKTVTGPQMAAEIVKLGGMGILHRFADFSTRKSDYLSVCNLFAKDKIHNVGLSIGVDKDELKLIQETQAYTVCIDVAHGDHQNCIDQIKRVKDQGIAKTIIAGNVATVEGAERLVKAGADVIKGNVGSGSLCSTRIETGNGVPSLTVMDNISKWLIQYNKYIDRVYQRKGVGLICDGGMKTVGDICKALCFADAVMLGNMLAGTDESPGEIISMNELKYKSYVGSSTHKTNRVEGVAGFVPYKGPVKNVIQKITEGIQSCCSYQGVDNLIDLKKDPQFVEISNAGLIESHPHSVLLK